MVDNRNIRRCANTPCSGPRTMMDKLRAIDFALIEINLYLDAYPKCRRAMEQYCKLIRERQKLAETINNSGNPLTSFENGCGEWNWVKGPWPWEPDAN